MFRTVSVGGLAVVFPGTPGQTRPYNSAIKPSNWSSIWSSSKIWCNCRECSPCLIHHFVSSEYNMERIHEETGCQPPCKYTEFSVPMNPLGSSFDINFTTLQISFSKSSIIQRKELLVYPLTSFVAEFGGTLGLFLGFSFLALWDLLEKLIKFIINK